MLLFRLRQIGLPPLQNLLVQPLSRSCVDGCHHVVRDLDGKVLREAPALIVKKLVQCLLGLIDFLLAARSTSSASACGTRGYSLYAVLAKTPPSA